MHRGRKIKGSGNSSVQIGTIFILIYFKKTVGSLESFFFFAAYKMVMIG